MKLYTKEWYATTGDMGVSVGFEPVPDKDEYSKEDIEALYQWHIQREYEEEMEDCEEANIKEIEALFQKSITIRKEYDYEDVWPWNKVDRRLLDMGMMPQSIYDQIAKADKEATQRYTREKENFRNILAKQRVPKRIRDIFEPANQVFRVEEKDGNLIILVRVMCHAITQTFLLKDVEILENELTIDPGEVAFQLYSEIYRWNREYEIHLFFETISSFGIESKWQYLTVRCSDVIDSRAAGETIVYEDYSDDKHWRYGVSLNNGYFIPWLQELWQFDATHQAYTGKAIYPLLEYSVFHNLKDAKEAIQNNLESLIVNNKDLLLALN